MLNIKFQKKAENILLWYYLFIASEQKENVFICWFRFAFVKNWKKHEHYSH